MRIVPFFIVAGFVVWAHAQDKPNSDSMLEIPGPQLRALIVSNAAFQASTQIPDSKKDLTNYRVEVFSGKPLIEVRFVPRMLPEDAQFSGGETKLGVIVSFYVDPKTWKVARTLFYK